MEILLQIHFCFLLFSNCVSSQTTAAKLCLEATDPRGWGTLVISADLSPVRLSGSRAGEGGSTKHLGPLCYLAWMGLLEC